MPGNRKRYIVRLSLDGRDQLDGLVNKGRVAAYRRRAAAILFAVDVGEYGTALNDWEVAEQLGVTARTIERMRIRCAEQGLEKALERKPRSREKTARLDGEADAQLLTLACSEAPEGRARWTLRLLADTRTLSESRLSWTT